MTCAAIIQFANPRISRADIASGPEGRAPEGTIGGGIGVHATLRMPGNGVICGGGGGSNKLATPAWFGSFHGTLYSVEVQRDHGSR